MPGGTSYVSVGMLTSAPASLAWNVVPTLTASGAEQTAQLATVCWTATSQAEAYCRQPLRATIVTEQLRGPGHPRVSIDPGTGEAGLITRRWPVTAVQAIQVSPSRDYPPQWTLVTPGQYRVRVPPLMDAGPAVTSGPYGGNAVDVAPGWIHGRSGRGYWNIWLSYSAGWPHAGLTADALAGDSTVAVDDVTGWDGRTGFVYDGRFTEPAAVTAATATAPVPLPGIGGTVQAGPAPSPSRRRWPPPTTRHRVLRAAAHRPARCRAPRRRASPGNHRRYRGAVHERAVRQRRRARQSAELALDPFRRWA